jgi:hypothetical protein
VEQFVADTKTTVLPTPERPFDNSALVRLMDKGILGDLGPLPTRDEIYAPRTL